MGSLGVCPAAQLVTDTFLGGFVLKREGWAEILNRFEAGLFNSMSHSALLLHGKRVLFALFNEMFSQTIAV